MAKSADAFRTISEVADLLDVPAHVLRFWESKFTQVKPVKRAGGRRYYRPADLRLLAGIKHLLHDEGMTIKGVQKLLREEGVQHVSAIAPDWGDETTAHDGTAQVLEFSRAPGGVVGPQVEPGPGQAKAADPPPEPAAPSETGPSDADTRAEAAPFEPAAEPDAPEAAAEALLPLPDLPDDPSDTLAAEPGPLSRLTALPRPLSATAARRLAGLARDLRARIGTGP
ncbi:MerR family transcriptional regulator [Roseovarius sp. MBR-6]|jgi:DNA-binding transcriptional MerR regulator|uniref:MerR family transcriptional regulator n=1 Tax=Roseovarius sp. MBR-6 TaxID=3156459 RepID=UPI00339207F5